MLSFAIYSVLLFAAFSTDSVERSVLPGKLSNALIGIFFLFYFTRGFVVTNIYTYVRVVSSKELASSRSGKLGYISQFGAAIGAVGSFLVLNVC